MYLVGIRTKSLIGSPEKIKETARRLRCFKIHSMVCVEDNAAYRGMFKRLDKHLIFAKSEVPVTVKNLHPPKGGFKKFRFGEVTFDCFNTWLNKMKWADL